MPRTVFFISDGTGITTETMGHSLLTQFPGVRFKQHRIPFIKDEARALDAVRRINESASEDGTPPIVFSTIVDDDLLSVLRESDGIFMDLFAAFIGQLERILGVPHTPTVGQAHGVVNTERYEHRIEATNYALSHDDGVSLDFAEADLVLVGVSRSGKTPTCLYLALHFGIKAGNYPLTEDDLHEQRLPEFLRPYRDRIIGLTITPERLRQIRETRRPGSRYASLNQCHWELDAAAELLRSEGIPVFETTHSSIEEIASRILQQLGMEKELF